MDERGVGESWDGVLHAGRVLFGARAETILGGGSWRRELKGAFRRRALETHPDRACSLGRPEDELAREFRMVVEAYRLLVEAPEIVPPSRARAGAPHRASGSSASPRGAPGEHHRRRDERAKREPERAKGARAAHVAGPAPATKPHAAKARGAAKAPAPARTIVPPRPVRLGEFLYYSRRIPFEALIEAIAWQRAQRPLVGRLAVQCGYLTDDQVLEVLDRRRRAHALDVPFAEYATRIGLLTPFARIALLARQGKLQRRIGRFFVERGWLTERGLAEARAAMAVHNAKHPAWRTTF